MSLELGLGFQEIVFLSLYFIIFIPEKSVVKHISRSHLTQLLEQRCESSPVISRPCEQETA